MSPAQVALPKAVVLLSGGLDSTTVLAIAKAEGFAPAAVVETSPGNLQAWLKHGETLDEVASTRAAKLLAERFGGDLGRPTGGISGAWPGSPTLSPAAA